MRDEGSRHGSETGSVMKTGKQKIYDHYRCQPHTEESNNNFVK